MINRNSQFNQRIVIRKFLLLISIVVPLPTVFSEKFIQTVTFQYNLFFLLRNCVNNCLRLRSLFLYCFEVTSCMKLLVWGATPYISRKVFAIFRLFSGNIITRLLQFDNNLMLVIFQNQQFRQAQKIVKAATVFQLFYQWKLRIIPCYDHPPILATKSNQKNC